MATQIVGAIKDLTKRSQELQAPAQSITLINGPLVIIGQGPFPQIIKGLEEIISTATAELARMKSTPTVAEGSDANAIFDAYREFVRVNQVFLNIMIGKAGLFNTVPMIGAPVAGQLRKVERVFDALAFALVDKVESRADDLKSQANSFEGTLTTAINSYDGLSL
ncbi:hypothetical protein Q7P36_004680 [Cladosporium allicinum]